MELKYVHTFPDIDLDDFEELLANQEFNQTLEKLPNVASRKLLEENDLGGGKRHTKVQYEGKGVPDQARKFIGEGAVGWIEEVDFNCNTHVHHFRLIPNRMRERVKCEGKYVLEPLGPGGGTKRTVTMEIKVKMLGVGKLAERMAKPLLESNAREEERLTREYIKANPPKKKGKSDSKKKK